MRNPLNTLRALHAVGSIVRDPNRLDKVFDLRDAVAERAVIAKTARFFEQDPGGRRALIERPRLGKLDLDELAKNPEGSLGRTFAEHMRKNGLDPAAIPTLPSRDPLEFVSAHLYESHDVWHVVTGFGTDVAGELGLQAFYVGQFPAKLSLVILAAGLLNTAIYAEGEREARLDAVVKGWEMGKRAKPFFGVKWAELWASPLAEVRERLGVPRDGVVLA